MRHCYAILDLTYNWYSGSWGKSKDHDDDAHNNVKVHHISLPTSSIIMEGIKSAIKECIDEGTLPNVS